MVDQETNTSIGEETTLFTYYLQDDKVNFITRENKSGNVKWARIKSPCYQKPWIQSCRKLVPPLGFPSYMGQQILCLALLSLKFIWVVAVAATANFESFVQFHREKKQNTKWCRITAFETEFFSLRLLHHREQHLAHDRGLSITFLMR